MITRREILATINSTTRETGHKAHPLAALALVCYLVREGKADRDGVEGLLVRSGWTI